MSSLPGNSSNYAVDNFLLETLMDSLQARNPVNNPLVSRSVEDYLYGNYHIEGDREIIPYEEGREELIREERKLEKEIINVIVNGKGDSLMPNSGEAVSVLGHNICFGCEEDDEGDCMVWEWHGHITANTDQYGYSPELIYGCYFQRLTPRKEKGAKEKGDQGLKDLIDDASKNSSAGRINHRGLNAHHPPRYL